MSKTAGLEIKRYFTRPLSKAYDGLPWSHFNSTIINHATQKPIFEQKDVEFPAGWSLNAINIVAQKYFAGNLGNQNRESSLRDLIDRVVNTIVRQGTQEGYFDAETEAEDFREELKFIIATQRAAFSSPVWLNISAPGQLQQATGCFILAVEDTMRSILDWYADEGIIIKSGFGSGINISRLRSSQEPLDKSSGHASGPVNFMRGADAVAGAINNGRLARRAANMVILNASHPDIEEFIWYRAVEERKARVLEQNGFDMTIDGRDITTVQYQYANNAVRVTDEFMQAVVDDSDWQLKGVLTGTDINTVKARDVFRQLAGAAWECADPSIQFDSTINRWHTAPNAGRINGSNPNCDYMHLDNTSCNISSINLLKYLNDDNTFNIEAFQQTIAIMVTAQEILVGYSEYPTQNIAKNSRAYRELGLGFTNLGTFLMAQGLAYDSAEGRAQAAAITALLTGYAYATSAKLARIVGPFAGFLKDRDAMIHVLHMHRDEVSKIDASLVSEDLLSAAAHAWDEAVDLGTRYGVRNSQATLLAPAGAIGLMMDSDTMGIEPNPSLIKSHALSGGGSSDSIDPAVYRALSALGYPEDQINDILQYLEVEKTAAGAPHLKKEHIAVFACSTGANAVQYLGYVRMMAAVQPFLSGTVSNTVNMPERSTIDEIEKLYIEAWRMGLKAVAVYRDNCKAVQTVFPAKEGDSGTQESVAEPSAPSIPESKIVVKGAVRRKLPKRRNGRTYKFSIADLEGYFTVSEYEDGSPGELFINVSKQGSTLSGLMDSFAIAVSHGLQYGVPLKSYARTLMNTTFAPSGITDDEDIKIASSITDYIVRRMAIDYLSFDDRLELGLASLDDMFDEQTSLLTDGQLAEASQSNNSTDREKSTDVMVPSSAVNKSIPSDAPRIVKDNTAPLCYNCGNQTQRSGNCYVCPSCGSTTGCS